MDSIDVLESAASAREHGRDELARQLLTIFPDLRPDAATNGDPCPRCGAVVYVVDTDRYTVACALCGRVVA